MRKLARLTLLTLVASSTATLSSLGLAAVEAAATPFPVGYSVDVDESGTTTSGDLGGSGQLDANNSSYGEALECAQSSEGGPFSIGHYPPWNCEQVGRSYNASGNRFWYTGNQHCVEASQPLSGAYFTWHVQLPQTGYWHVAAYIPSWTQYGWGDRYALTSDEGLVEDTDLTQQAYHGQWVTLLGSRRFTASRDYTAELKLVDEGDPYCHYQMADQIEWTYDGPSAPEATIISPASGGTYPQGAVVRTNFTCTEALKEAIASCTDSNGASGGAGRLDTSTVGPHTYIVTATGVEGATGTAEIGYTVAPAKIACSADSGKATYSPGLTDAAAVQAIKVKGSLTGCAGGGFTSAKYTATLKTTNALSCASLDSAGEPATGTVTISWLPKAKGGKSIGSFSMPVTEKPAAALDGTLESGPFSPATLYGEVSQTYSGAATCGAAVKNKVKPVKKATFTGSAIQLY